MKTIDLCGTWRLRNGDGCRGAIGEWPNEQPYLPAWEATVPGTVQEAMAVQTGDINRAHNVLAARWIEEDKWLYDRTFTLTEADCAKEVRLVFLSLDLTAQIFVNGQSVGWHNNYYTPCRLDVTAAVHPGENTLAILIESGLYWSADKPMDDIFFNSSTTLPKRVWLRKPQSTFAWDWSPRLINVGIPQPCWVEVSDGVFANETKLYARLNDDYSVGTMDLTQYLHGAKAGVPYTVTATLEETGATATVEGISPLGDFAVSLKMTVEKPDLWYPRGYGAQALYTVTITLTCGAKTQTITKKTGFRRAEIDQSPHPVEGKYFILTINGVRVFAKGGNMVPVDTLCSRFTRDVYETLIDRAVEANCNALRVWGGGLYETDDFYALCDEYGIVVWQDFVNACANYPADNTEFAWNIEEEYRYTVRRLSSHPSLVIYCGNNEIDWMMQSLPNKRRYPDAHLYYWTLPRILGSEGDDRYYQPSSPYAPDAIDDNSPVIGDQHPWSIGFGDRDYYKYRQMVDRFPNEGGILGPTSLPNMMLCLGEGQDYIHSFDWQVHDNSIAHTNGSTADRIVEEWLGMTVKTMSVRDYVYYGGFCQGEGLTEYILNFRRRMPSSASAIFWMYNDCWPATRSWTIVDYLRNRTPSFHPVRRAFAPVAVDIAKVGETYEVWGINERLTDKCATVEVGGFTKDGAYITATLQVTLPANASTCVAVIGNLPDGYIPYAILSADGEPVARRRYLEVRYHELGLTPCDIRVEKDGDETTYTADRLVLGVCIDLDGADNGPEDNFFDLYPGKPVTVRGGGDVLYAYMGD